jgi:hypothetical protein
MSTMLSICLNKYVHIYILANNKTVECKYTSLIGKCQNEYTPALLESVKTAKEKHTKNGHKIIPFIASGTQSLKERNVCIFVHLATLSSQLLLAFIRLCMGSWIDGSSGAYPRPQDRIRLAASKLVILNEMLRPENKYICTKNTTGFSTQDGLESNGSLAWKCAHNWGDHPLTSYRVEGHQSERATRQTTSRSFPP